jgi:hypothetical protein
MKDDRSRLRRLESPGTVAATRYLSSAVRMSRVPLVGGIKAQVNWTVGGRNEIIVSWTDSIDPDVLEYEVWIERFGMAPTRVGTASQSPADISIVTGTTGAAAFRVMTIMRNGVKLDLSLCPTATVTLTA